MKFSCTQENLQTSLSFVTHIPTQQLSLPILANVLIEAKDGAVRFAATNLEFGVQSILRGRIEEEGRITVPMKLTSDYVALLPKDRVNITTDETKLNIKGKNQKATIPGISADDFPLIPRVKAVGTYTIKRTSFVNALDHVLFAASARAIKPEFGGALLHCVNGNNPTLTCVTTDSYRLAEFATPILSASSESEIIVPLQSLTELSRILSLLTSEEITIEVGEGQIMFHDDQFSLFSRLIDGHFPDHKKIIPQKSDTTVTLPLSELITTVRAASLFAQSGMFDVTFTVHSKTNRLTISAESGQRGSHESELNCDCVGPDVRITFNYRQLIDGLTHISSNDVSLEFSTGSDPALIVPKDQSRYRYLLMPLRQ